MMAAAVVAFASVLQTLAPLRDIRTLSAKGDLQGPTTGGSTLHAAKPLANGPTGAKVTGQPAPRRHREGQPPTTTNDVAPHAAAPRHEQPAAVRARATKARRDEHGLAGPGLALGWRRPRRVATGHGEEHQATVRECGVAETPRDRRRIHEAVSGSRDAGIGDASARGEAF